jgi:hypothetical protein
MADEDKEGAKRGLPASAFLHPVVRNGDGRKVMVWYNVCSAGVAQLVEQLFRKQQVTGSIPVSSLVL